MQLFEYVTMSGKWAKHIWSEETNKLPPEFRLTFQQYKILDLIAEGCNKMNHIIDPTLRPSQVRERIWMADRSVTSSLVGKLKQGGLINLRQRARDKRAYHLVVSEKGKRALAACQKVDAIVEASLRERIEPYSLPTTTALRALSILNIKVIGAEVEEEDGIECC